MVNEMAFASVFALKSKLWKNINGLPEGSSSVFFFFIFTIFTEAQEQVKKKWRTAPQSATSSAVWYSHIKDSIGFAHFHDQMINSEN